MCIRDSSQGAQAVNRQVASWLRDHCDFRSDLEVVHQVGAKNEKEWSDFYGGSVGGNLRVLPYLHDMPERLRWADICICRAGIGTVVELAMTQTPAIFVPLPSAGDNHQQKNAEVLVERDGSWMMLQDQMSPKSLNEFFKNIFENPVERKQRSQNLNTIDFSHSAEDILKSLLGDKLCN